MTVKNAPLRYTLLFLAYAALGIAINYTNLNNPFLHDDKHHIRDNKSLESLDNIPSFYYNLSTFWKGDNKDLYRPLLLTSFALNNRIDGKQPWSWRVGNILIIALNAVLLVAVARRYGVGVAVAGVAGAIWAAHPLTGYCVALVGARSALLLTFFILSGVLFHHSAMQGKGRTGVYMVASMGCMALGLLSVSAAVVFPAFVLLIEGRNVLKSPARAVVRIAPYALLSLGYILARKFLLGRGFGGGYVRPLWTNFLVQCKAWWVYIRFTLYPERVQVFAPIDDQFGPFDILTLAALAAVVLWSAAGVYKWLARDDNRTGVFILWPLLAYLPYAVIPLNVPVAYHHYHLALGGVVVLTTVAFGDAAERHPGKFVPIGIVLLLCFAILGKSFADTWKSSLAFAWRSVEVTPSSGRTWNELGIAHLEEKDYEKAIKYLRRSMEMDKGLVQINASLALAYVKNGNYVGALECIDRYDSTPQLGGVTPELKGMAGIALVELGRPRSGIEVLDEVIESLPDRKDLPRYRAMAARVISKSNEAMRNFDLLYGPPPDEPEVLAERYEVLNETGDLELARVFIEKSMEAHPGSPLVAHLDVRSLLEMGMLKRASEAVDAALERYPEYAPLWEDRGDIYLRERESGKALEAFRKALVFATTEVGKERLEEKIGDAADEQGSE